MDGICFWDLGPGWKSDSHGSVSFSTLSVSSPLPLSVIDHSQMVSALFRPPVASYFRVPLRPSYLPVRLLFIVELILLSKEGEEEGFVSLSNIKLVNNEGIEIGCQTLEDNNYLKTTTISFIKEEGKEEGDEENIKEYERKLLSDAGIEWLAKQPTPLRLPLLTLNDIYPQTTPTTPLQTQFINPIPQPKQTIFKNSILQKGALITTKTFNPFQVNFNFEIFVRNC
ncbi:unnamed protein product [Meloidogyne enterolobii]|uniref:Uncharacterized protein n=1 Tax=Meloidogyne enterolobii TaxID=390850 RepID=A0ACB1AZE1_MELEN